MKILRIKHKLGELYRVSEKDDNFGLPAVTVKGYRGRDIYELNPNDFFICLEDELNDETVTVLSKHGKIKIEIVDGFDAINCKMIFLKNEKIEDAISKNILKGWIAYLRRTS